MEILICEIRKNVKVCFGLIEGEEHIDIDNWGAHGADSCFEKEIVCTEIYQEIDLGNKNMMCIYTYINEDSEVVHKKLELYNL